NVDGPRAHTSLYFATQDNGLWASPDSGAHWPANDCAEGFNIQVQPHSATDSGVTVAYGRTGGPGCSPGAMFSDANFANQRGVPNVDTAGNAVSDLGDAFLINPGSWIRYRTPMGANPELWVSIDDGLHWRRRATVTLQIAGVP